MELQNKFKAELVQIDYRKIKPFQGSLKVQNDDEYQALKNSLEKRGVLGPMYVWKKPNGKTWFTFDGHQRLKVYNHEKATFEGGYEVPCIEIEAETEEQAREYLLALNGRYAQMTEQGIIEFAGDIDMDSLSDIMLPDIGDLNFLAEHHKGEANKNRDMLDLDEFEGPGTDEEPADVDVPEELANRDESDGVTMIYFSMTFDQKIFCQKELNRIKNQEGYSTLGEALFHTLKKQANE